MTNPPFFFWPQHYILLENNQTYPQMKPNHSNFNHSKRITLKLKHNRACFHSSVDLIGATSTTTTTPVRNPNPLLKVTVLHPNVQEKERTFGLCLHIDSYLVRRLLGPGCPLVKFCYFVGRTRALVVHVNMQQMQARLWMLTTHW